MKPRDIFKAQIEHVETESIPYTIDFDADIDIQLDEYYGDTAWRDSIQTFHKVAAVVNNRKRFPTDTPGIQKDVWGSTWRLDRRPEHLQQPGLVQPSFKGYRWPAPEEFLLGEKEIESAKNACGQEREDYFIIARLGWGLLESSWGLRGFENAMMDMAAEPEFTHALLDKLAESHLKNLKRYLAAVGEYIQIIQMGDDLGTQTASQISPAVYREYILIWGLPLTFA